MAIFAVLSLRSTGISFMMITLALGEIIWGVVYRWISITGGDNGVNLTAAEPFGISLVAPVAFYYATLVVFVICLLAVGIFVRSPLGAALKGTRDQPRRMTALGYNVWVIRFWPPCSPACDRVAGILFVYYNQFISPQASISQFRRRCC